MVYVGVFLIVGGWGGMWGRGVWGMEGRVVVWGFVYYWIYLFLFCLVVLFLCGKWCLVINEGYRV